MRTLWQAWIIVMMIVAIAVPAPAEDSGWLEATGTGTAGDENEAVRRALVNAQTILSMQALAEVNVKAISITTKFGRSFYETVSISSNLDLRNVVVKSQNVSRDVLASGINGFEYRGIIATVVAAITTKDADDARQEYWKRIIEQSILAASRFRDQARSSYAENDFLRTATAAAAADSCLGMAEGFIRASTVGSIDRVLALRPEVAQIKRDAAVALRLSTGEGLTFRVVDATGISGTGEAAMKQIGSNLGGITYNIEHQNASTARSYILVKWPAYLNSELVDNLKSCGAGRVYQNVGEREVSGPQVIIYLRQDVAARWARDLEIYHNENHPWVAHTIERTHLRLTPTDDAITVTTVTSQDDIYFESDLDANWKLVSTSKGYWGFLKTAEVISQFPLIRRGFTKYSTRFTFLRKTLSPGTAVAVLGEMDENGMYSVLPPGAQSPTKIKASDIIVLDLPQMFFGHGAD